MSRFLFLALVLGAVSAAAAPPKQTTPKTAVVTIKTRDGMSLKADWTPPTAPKRGVIIGLHMVETGRMAFQPLLEFAAVEGLGVLALDLRGHGESRTQKGKDLLEAVQRRDPALFTAMPQDVEAALKFVKSKGFASDKVVLIGGELGAQLALTYAATDPKLRAAVLLTPEKEAFGLGAMGPARQWGDRPLLIVTAKDHEALGPKQVYEALDAKTKRRAVLLTVPQEGMKGTRLFGVVPNLPRRLVEWAAIQLGRDAHASKPMPKVKAAVPVPAKKP